MASYDTAVLPVFGWVNSNDWIEAYQSHFEDFFGEIAEVTGAPIQAILGELPMVLWARAARCGFEDFLNTQYEGSPSNPLDHYLSEVGMDLAEADVDFLVAFRNSMIRVYDVVDRIPYDKVVLRDLADGASLTQIEDEMLTAPLSAGDHIATRIVTVAGKAYLAGAILVLSDETLENYKTAFEYAFKEEMRNVEKYLQKDLRQRNIIRQRVLEAAGPMISGMWLASILSDLGDSLLLSKADEPESTFQAIISYDLQLESLLELLDAHPDLERALRGEFFWLWHTDRSTPGSILKAIVWLSGPEILVESSNAGRLDEAVNSLAELLGDSFLEASIRQLDDELDEDDEEDDDDEDFPLLPMPLNDEEASVFRGRVHNYLDEHYRSLLDSPVEELNDRIPRELAKTAKGQKQLNKWLQSTEAQLHANTDQIGLADYDLRWIWKELGIESMRQSSLFE